MSISMSRDLGGSSPSSSNNTPPPYTSTSISTSISTVVKSALLTDDTFTSSAAPPPRQKKRKLSSCSDDTHTPRDEEHVHNNASSSSPCRCQCHVLPRCCACPRLDSYPKGFRFCPKDDELLFYYLLKKLKNEELPENRIFEVNIYKDDPENITEKYVKANDVEWFFFTERERKYPNGERPRRDAGNGYWKATGPDKQFKKNGRKIGAKKSLVFYVGKSPHGEKTDWMMQEYVLKGHEHHKTDKLDMKLDDYVLCKIYKKHEKGGSNKADDATQQVPAAPPKTSARLLLNQVDPAPTTSARVLSNQVDPAPMVSARVLLNRVAAAPPMTSARVLSNQVDPPTTSVRGENYVLDQQNHDVHHQNTQFPSYDHPAHLAFSMNQMRGGFPQASSTPLPPPPFVNQNQNQNHPCLSRYQNRPNLPNPNPDPAPLAFESGQQTVGYQQQSFSSHNRSVLPIPPLSVATPPAAAAAALSYYEHQSAGFDYQQHSLNSTILPNLLHPDAIAVAVAAFGHGQPGYQRHPFIQPAAAGPEPRPFLHPPHYTSSVAVAAASDDQSYLDSGVESYWDATNTNSNLPPDNDDMGIGLQDLDDINGNWGDDDIHSLQNEMNHDQTPRDSLSKHDDTN